MLGLVWTQEDLDVLAKQAEGQKQMGNMTAEQLEASAPTLDEGPRTLRYPLSLLVRPELIKNLQEHALPTAGGLFGMSHVPKDATSLYGSTKEEFLRRMGATAASAAGDDFERSNVDPFAQSQRPRGGFSESRPRPIGGGGRRK
jgi:hypothetical protein